MGNESSFESGKGKITNVIKGKPTPAPKIGNSTGAAPAPAGKPKAPVAPAARASGPAPSAAGPAMPDITTTPMNNGIMDEMTTEISRVFPGKSEYRIIGGVALAKLGSLRTTKDLDLLVRDKTTDDIVQKLQKTGKFGALRKPGGAYQVWFRASNGKNYNVDVMRPSQIYSSLAFPASSYPVGNTALPGIPELLNLKILAYLVRKNPTDAQDILFLVRWMAAKKMKTSVREVPYADEDFLLPFVVQKNSESKTDWDAIGLPPVRS